jgi:hypothetical protein
MKGAFRSSTAARTAPELSWLACLQPAADTSAMPHRPPRKKKAETIPGDAAADRKRRNEIAQRQRADTAARSTLSRFQNRKSEKK